MKKLLALLLAAAMAFSFAACGQKPQQKSQVEILTYAYNSSPVTNWDPSVEFSNGIITLNNVYETLLSFNAQTKEYTPVLATSYEKSDDGLTWTFKLREGVKFHDGTDFTSAAVKFSVERTRRIGQGASFIWGPVESIETPDDYTVVFKLSYPAPVDMIAACPYAAFIMSPALADKPDDFLADGKTTMGTGPYTVQSYTMGDEVILQKFNDYWRGWDGKHFEKVVLKRVSETSSRRQMIEKGEADITMDLPSEDIAALQKTDGVEVMVEPSLTNLMGFFNTKKEALKDVRVRQALSYSFPYEDVVKYGVGGFATQSVGPVPKGLWGHSDDLFQYSYDLEKAKSLLAEAGVKEGDLKLLLTYMSGDEGEKKAAELYKGELSKLGVDLEIRAMQWESQWELARGSDVASQQDILVMYWWCDLATPYSFLYNLFHSEEDPLYNLAYYSNPEVDTLIDQAQLDTATDMEKATQQFVDAQKLIIEDSPALLMYDKNALYVKRDNLKGFVDNPSYPNVVFAYDCYRDNGAAE